MEPESIAADLAFWGRVWGRARKETGHYIIEILTGLVGSSLLVLVLQTGLYWWWGGWEAAAEYAVPLLVASLAVFICSFMFLFWRLVRLPPLMERESAAAHEEEQASLQSRLADLETPSILSLTYRPTGPWFRSSGVDAAYTLTIRNTSDRPTNDVRIMLQVVVPEIDMRAPGAMHRHNLRQLPKKWEIGKLSAGEPHVFPLITQELGLAHLCVGPEQIRLPCWFYRFRVQVFCDASGPVIQNFTFTPDAHARERLTMVDGA